MWMLFFFFFQAEDGIRDYKVTGVQTCALPICSRRGPAFPETATRARRRASGPCSSAPRAREGRAADRPAPCGSPFLVTAVAKRSLDPPDLPMKRSVLLGQDADREDKEREEPKEEAGDGEEDRHLVRE